MPTVMDPITEMEVAHTVWHAFIAGIPSTPTVLPTLPVQIFIWPKKYPLLI
jgi:hypothetical protein